MRELFERRPSHAAVVAYVALFVALGGVGAYAAATIGSKDIKPGAVHSKHIAGGEVKSTDLGRGSVGGAKVADESLTAADLNESLMASDAMLTALVDLPSTNSLPTGYGSVSGTSSADISATAVDMISPNATLVARNLITEFDAVDGVSARRVVLRVNGVDTALACQVGPAPLPPGLKCTSPVGAEANVPAGSHVVLKFDNGGEGLDTGATSGSVAFSLTGG